MSSALSIRIANEQDAEALLAIYSPYVSNTAITFEYTVPTLNEFKSRITTTLTRYPYLVIVKDNHICGYAYASTFKPRAAYDWSVETTIYLEQGHHGMGLGRKLYDALESVLRLQHIINVNACITSENSPYVTNGSEQFHHKLGYTKIAHFTKCGYKFNQWFDVIWMEKFIGEHQPSPPPFVPFSSLNINDINNLFAKFK